MAKFGVFDGPLRVLLIPKIPSAHRSGKYYPVVLLYKATDQPNNYVGAQHRLGYQGASAHLRAICCLKSEDSGCPVGARVTSPCAHGVSALMAGCVLPHHQVYITQYLNTQPNTVLSLTVSGRKIRQCYYVIRNQGKVEPEMRLNIGNIEIFTHFKITFYYICLEIHIFRFRIVSPLLYRQSLVSP